MMQPGLGGTTVSNGTSSLQSARDCALTGGRGGLSGIKDTVVVATSQAKRRDSCIIDPRSSRFLTVWDAAIAVALIFTAVITPYEVAFLPAPSLPVDLLFVTNRLIDVLFIIDIGLNFCLMYHRVDSIQGGLRWVGNRFEIAKNYISHWFFIDFFSVGVSAFDVISISSGDNAAAKETASRFKLLRVLRALRLIKLLRLARASRIFKRCARTETSATRAQRRQHRSPPIALRPLSAHCSSLAARRSPPVAPSSLAAGRRASRRNVTSVTSLQLGDAHLAQLQLPLADALPRPRPLLDALDRLRLGAADVPLLRLSSRECAAEDHNRSRCHSSPRPTADSPLVQPSPECATTPNHHNLRLLNPLTSVPHPDATAWMNVYGYCRDASANGTLLEIPSNWRAPDDTDLTTYCAPPLTIYVASVYWAMMIITGN